jgi:RHS repeat-associated protein
LPVTSDLARTVIFRGRRYDHASGTFVHGEYLYDPRTGRYLQPGDPDLVNRYTFAGNDPAGGMPR